MSSELVSIIVPCYNGTAFIGETIHSILAQNIGNFEIIVVDDGSTDNLSEKLREFDDHRIKYVHQENQGVSVARNNGISCAAGSYIICFDADDKMSEGFIEARLQMLQQNKDIDFICGEVSKFNSGGISRDYFRGTSNEAIREILLFDPLVTTCPSNYMYRSSFIKKNKLNYNTNLSSTADKLFLIEASLKGKSTLVKGRGNLFYRVSDLSMSHHFTENLVKDNEKYYSILVHKNLIPPVLRKESLYLGNLMLSGSFWKIKKPGKAFSYGVKALLLDPVSFFKKIFR